MGVGGGADVVKGTNERTVCVYVRVQEMENDETETET